MTFVFASMMALASVGLIFGIKKGLEPEEF